MSKLKIQFHVHTKQDPLDNIKHSEHQAIDQAARLGYDVMSITCHNVVIFNEDLKKYAAAKRILLIPGIEKTIEKKHILILNADISAQKINTFEDLRNYRQKHPDILTIAAHPYYPASIALGKKLEEHIDLFDAIEYSWFHTKKINKYNKKAIQIAQKHNKPIIGTSDNHLIKYFDQTFSLIEAEKNINSIFKAIKNNKIQIISHDLSFWELISSYTTMEARYLLKKFVLNQI